MFVTSQHAHFIGIGGIGMSGIAEILLNMGFQVSGSDLRRGSVTDRLAQLGATIFEGHKAANISGATVVVTSSAVSPSNPEVVEARGCKIPVIQRAEMLAERMRLKYVDGLPPKRQAARHTALRLGQPPHSLPAGIHPLQNIGRQCLDQPRRVTTDRF